MREVESDLLRIEYFHERQNKDKVEGAKLDLGVPISARYKDGAKVGSDANFSRDVVKERILPWHSKASFNPTTEQNFHYGRSVSLLSALDTLLPSLYVAQGHP